MLREKLGQKIREARLAADLTQEELGFAAEISRNYVSLLELGESSPTVDILVQICKVLGVSAGEMLREVE